jgi:hypothetical protein
MVYTGVMRTFTGLLTATAALAAAMALEVPVSQAQSYGDARWCAVTDHGTGEVVWDCEYQTIEQCQPQVIAGNRGSCNLNPRWSPPVAAAPYRHRKHHHG